MRTTAQLGTFSAAFALALTLSALQAPLSSPAQACSPSEPALALFPEGAHFPAGAVLPFEGGYWDLDLLLEDGVAPPDDTRAWFHVSDVVRVQQGTGETGTDVPGTLERVAGVDGILIFRPAGLMAGREVMLPARWVAGRASRET